MALAAPPLPTGTVTFLFTDLEGSTKLFEAHRSAYPQAVARHTSLLSRAVAEHHGVVFETVGDAVYAAFPTPSGAVSAAIAGQRALEGEDWGALGRLRARMGIHSGEAQAQEGHYVGAPLYRCARVMATGWGGQVVVSAAAASLARDALPTGADLRDLGEHRLKDLQAPEHVYQLVHPSLPEEFPPLRTISARPHNLPVLRDAFVGREPQIREATALLARSDVGVLTVTGPGGVGKTRFSLHLAGEALEGRRAGAWYVDLSQLTDIALVPHAIASVFGLRESGGLDLRRAVLGYFAASDALLVLDNFEQLTAAADLVAELTARCPDLKVVVTSREPLRIRGEQEFPLGPLGSTGETAISPAIDLFVERARRVAPTFAPSGDELRIIGQICARLDGLPLAIELASARVRTMPPRTILSRLVHRLPLLTGGSRDLPARQRTLRDTIKWSYDLLTPEEQRFLRRLSVFRGSWTADDAAEVSPADDVYGLIDALVAKSLVVPVASADEGRYRLLELVREFAAEELERNGERVEARSRHARHVAASLRGAAVRMRGRDQLQVVASIDRDLDDVREVLRSGIEDLVAFGEEALAVAGELYPYWIIRANVREAGTWAKELIATFEPNGAVPPGIHLTACIALAELGDLGSALRHGEIALRSFRRAGDPCGAIYGALFAAEYQVGTDDAAAKAFATMAHTLAEECGGSWAHGCAALIDGEIARYEGDIPGAIASYSSAMVALSDDAFLRAGNTHNLAHARLRAGEPRRAAELFATTLDDPAFYTWMGPYSLAGLAAVAATLGEVERAAVLFGAARSASGKLGMSLQPVDQAEYDRHTAAVRESLGAAAYEAASARGAAMTLDEAISLAKERPAEPIGG